MKKIFILVVTTFALNCHGMEIQPVGNQKSLAKLQDPNGAQVQSVDVEYPAIVCDLWQNPQLTIVSLGDPVRDEENKAIVDGLQKLTFKYKRNGSKQTIGNEIEFKNFFLTLLKNGGANVIDNAGSELIIEKMVEKKLPLKGMEEYAAQNEVVTEKVLYAFMNKLPEFDQHMSNVDSANLQQRYNIQNTLNTPERLAASKLVEYMKTKHLSFFIANQEHIAALLPGIRKMVIQNLANEEIKDIINNNSQGAAYDKTVIRLVLEKLDEVQIQSVSYRRHIDIANIQSIKKIADNNFIQDLKTSAEKLKDASSLKDAESVIADYDENTLDVLKITQPIHEMLAAKKRAWYQKPFHLLGALTGYTLFLNYFGSHTKSALNQSFSYLYATLKTKLSKPTE